MKITGGYSGFSRTMINAKQEMRELWRQYERVGEHRDPKDYPVHAVYIWSCLPDDSDAKQR